MNKSDTREAAPLIDRVLDGLLKLIPTRGRAGSEARSLIGDTRANITSLLKNDELGPPLDQCFEATRVAGAIQNGFAALRGTIEAESPVTLGAVLMKNSCVGLCLAEETRILAEMVFVSRQDVDALKTIMNAGFIAAEEIAADDMDQMTYRALVEAHAAVINYLVETGRPLARVVNFRFAVTQPTLVMAYRLYQDAGRADELRAENKTVHPAFSLPTGVALSA